MRARSSTEFVVVRSAFVRAARVEQEENRTTTVTVKVIDIVITDRFHDAPVRPNVEFLSFCPRLEVSADPSWCLSAG